MFMLRGMDLSRHTVRVHDGDSCTTWISMIPVTMPVTYDNLGRWRVTFKSRTEVWTLPMRNGRTHNTHPRTSMWI